MAAAAQVGVGGGRDRDPGTEAPLGALAVVGTALAPAEPQPVDGTGGGVGGVGQRGDRPGGGVAEGGRDELEVGAAGHALGGSVFVAVVGDAVGVDGQALERQPPQGGSGGQIGRAATATEGPGRPVKGHAAGVERVDQFVHTAAGGAAAGLLAEQDGAPGGVPDRVTLAGAGDDHLLGAAGQVDPDQPRIGDVLFVAGDQPAGMGVVGPMGSTVGVGGLLALLVAVHRAGMWLWAPRMLFQMTSRMAWRSVSSRRGSQVETGWVDNDDTIRRSPSRGARRSRRLTALQTYRSTERGTSSVRAGVRRPGRGRATSGGAGGVQDQRAGPGRVAPGVLDGLGPPNEVPITAVNESMPSMARASSIRGAQARGGSGPTSVCPYPGRDTFTTR